MLTLLRLVTAHLVGDFLLQTAVMAARRGVPRPLARDTAIHAGLYLLALAPRPMGEALTLSFALAAVHATIDYGTSKWGDDGAIAFCVDQAAHLSTIAIVAAMAPTLPFPAMSIGRELLMSPRVSLFVGGYIATVFGAGHLVQRITAHFGANIDQSVLSKKPGLPDAGRYIGWLERFLIVTFLLAGHGEVIALLIGAKAIIRYPELRDNEKGHFADYFLIGTMTSVGVALAGGIALLYLSGQLIHL